jgi:hypothetical protein
MSLALDQVSAAACLVSYLMSGAELTAGEAGRLVSGRTGEEWRQLKARRRQGFVTKARRILLSISSKVPIYDVMEERDGHHTRVWRYVGGRADLEYMERVAPGDVRGHIPGKGDD